MMLLFLSVNASYFLSKSLIQQDVLKFICCVELTKGKFVSVKQNKDS